MTVEGEVVQVIGTGIVTMTDIENVTWIVKGQESGMVEVEYQKIGQKIKFKIVIPSNVSAKFKYERTELQLKTGVNEFEI